MHADYTFSVQLVKSLLMVVFHSLTAIYLTVNILTLTNIYTYLYISLFVILYWRGCSVIFFIVYSYLKALFLKTVVISKS